MAAPHGCCWQPRQAAAELHADESSDWPAVALSPCAAESVAAFAEGSQFVRATTARGGTLVLLFDTAGSDWLAWCLSQTRNQKVAIRFQAHTTTGLVGMAAQLV